MGAHSVRNLVLPIAILFVGLTVVVVLGPVLGRNRPELPPGYDDSDLSMNGSRLKGFALGFEGLMADWYWMRSLQYVGGKIVRSDRSDLNIDDLSNLNPRLLYPFLENATDLDPHFIAAYSYGAIVLPAIDPEKAIAITEKGIANNPGEWRLYQHLGYIYWKLKLYDKAAEIYERGSQVPDAAPFMKSMVASMKTEGGSRATARQIYREMLDGSSDPSIRYNAERRLLELDSLDEREAIDRTLSEFLKRNGQCVNSLIEIVPALLKIDLPENKEFRVDKSNRLVDPTDAPYLLDRETCTVKVDVERTKLPVK